MIKEQVIEFIDNKECVSIKINKNYEDGNCINLCMKLCLMYIELKKEAGVL
jgi:hypothetical protein